MPKYEGFANYEASVYLGTFETDSEEDAMDHFDHIDIVIADVWEGASLNFVDIIIQPVKDGE